MHKSRHSYTSWSLASRRCFIDASVLLSCSYFKGTTLLTGQQTTFDSKRQLWVPGGSEFTIPSAWLYCVTDCFISCRKTGTFTTNKVHYERLPPLVVLGKANIAAIRLCDRLTILLSAC